MSRFWTKEKVELLSAYIQANMSYQDIAKRMGKTVDSIDHAIRRYNLKKFIKAADSPAYSITGLDDAEFEKAKAKAKTKWDIPKPKKGKDKEGKRGFRTFLVTADHHVPEQNEPALRAIYQLMDDVAFDGHIILGDFMDMGPIGHWNKNKKKSMEMKRLKEDYIVGNAILDEFDKRLKDGAEKFYFYGNHEDWYFQLIEEMPALEGLLDPKEELHLVERGYTVYTQLNYIKKMGKLNLTHGMYTPMHYVKKHIDEFKSNIMFGHLHSPRMRFESAVGHEVAMAGYCLGCLCDMNPNYMKNRPNKWAHGFGIIYFYDDGSGQFDVDLKRIVKGKFVFNNVLYDGNKK